MKKLLTLLVAAILAVGCCFGLTACGKKKAVVGLICLHGESSTYDKNFIDAFKQACKNKGLSKKQYTIVTDIPEDSTCKETALDLADSGCKAIFADSFGHEPFIIEVAKACPDVQFFHATGVNSQSEGLNNFHNAFASIYEGRYLAGYAAGLKLMTMTDKAVDKNFKVGYVGAWTYAEVISGYTSWFLGLQAALSDGYTATMEVTFTGSWYDEAGEKSAAQTLIDDGCVLISQHADSMGAPTACDNSNVPNVAYNGSTGKNTLVAYSKIDWTNYFEKMIDCALEGKEVETDYCGKMSDGYVKYEIGPAAAEGTADKVKAVADELKAGTRKVFDLTKFTVGGVALDATTCAPGDATWAGFNKAAELIADGYYHESELRSAPSFDITIDGIKLLNAVYGTKADGTPDIIDMTK
ncbi:MAG: BMP family ABC transporter substrate-binding protein [Clostridia bacterium]|nr:BMP family ABC transporter substrate-binding protein [Clostridia bacterium]